jgi:fructose-bisphosphate aldolase class II
MTSRVATIDRSLVTQLTGAVPVPLVLHGSSGLSDDELVAAVRAGMTKINISTHLNGLFTMAVRTVLAADAAVVDPRKYVQPAREAVAVEVERLLLLLAL